MIIFVTVLIDLIGFGIVIPVLPYYVEGSAFNGSPFELGMIMASYSIMQFIFLPIFGSISDRYGRRPVLFFSILGTAAGFFIVGAATTLWMVFLGRIIDGITGGNISTAQAYIADVTSQKNRAKGMGLIGAAFGIGFTFGPALGGLLSRNGPSLPFYAAGVMAILNAAALYFFLPESVDVNKLRPGVQRRNRFTELFDSLRDIRFRGVTVIYFFLVVAFSIMTTSFTLYTMFRFGYNAEQNGYIFFVIGILAIILQGGLFGKLVHIFGEPKLVLIGSLMLMLGFTLIPFVSRDTGGLAALMACVSLFAIGNSIASPALTSLGSKNAPDHEQGKALGVMQSGASLARAIGPAAAGILMNTASGNMDDISVSRTYFSAAALMLITCVFSIYYLFRKNIQVTA